MLQYGDCSHPKGSKPGVVSPARKTRVPGTRALIRQARAGPYKTLQTPARRCIEKPKDPNNTSDKGLGVGAGRG